MDAHSFIHQITADAGTDGWVEGWMDECKHTLIHNNQSLSLLRSVCYNVIFPPLLNVQPPTNLLP